MADELKKTPFYNLHVQSGAKIVPFAGFLMPVQYRGITEEHRSVRSSVGLFDLSHMGEFVVTGQDALAFLQKMTVNDVAALAPCQVQYSCMCYPEGGIVDDLLVYRLPDHYWLVVNASNIAKDFGWLKEHLSGDVQLRDISDQTGLLAIQGPKAEPLLAKLTDYPLATLKFYWAAEGIIAGEKVLFSRTGYTGEDGFEIYCKPEQAEKLWQAAMEAGDEFDVEPIGLGARDSLRLEMKYMLYGNDIDRTTNPIEAGLGWIVKTDKGDFIGREVIVQARQQGVRKLVAFEMTEKAIPRHGYEINATGQRIGQVTSGTFSPSLEKGIGLGYVPKQFAAPGQGFGVAIRDRIVPAVVVQPPFWKQYSHK